MEKNELIVKIKKEIKQDYYQQNFPNDGQRFLAWYLRNIHLKDESETKDAITDGANDKQIDAIIVDDDKSTIFIFQGKFIGSNKVDGSSLREVLSSWIQVKDLVRLQEVANDKLKRKLAEVSKAFEDEYEIAFELLTTGELTESAKKDYETFQKKLAELSEKEDLVSTVNVVDSEEIIRRYEIASQKENPLIKYTIDLSNSKFLPITISKTNCIIAAIPLKECLTIPGIKDGTLFQKNVRQSLGLNNAVNKGIKNTIYNNHLDFFFFHNGVTALCSKMKLEGNKLHLVGLNVVNGCQSLNTILSCSEEVKKLKDTYILFRFYEIPERERSDNISTNTNSQSTVKPRDLRSNDKRVLSLKRDFEQKYSKGYFITKRGEIAPANKNKMYVIDLVNLGKYLITWQSQRPNIAYSEAKIFDKYFEQLFKKDYSPDKIQALNEWMNEVWKKWIKENPLGLNESLLAMRAYAPYHHLYAISICFGVANSMPIESVPDPYLALIKARENNIIDQIIELAGKSLSFALQAAASEPQQGDRVFSPQNWIKTKTCLAGIRAAVSQSLNMYSMMNPKMGDKLKQGLKIEREGFEARWTAD